MPQLVVPVEKYDFVQFTQRCVGIITQRCVGITGGRAYTAPVVRRGPRARTFERPCCALAPDGGRSHARTLTIISFIFPHAQSAARGALERRPRSLAAASRADRPRVPQA